MKSAVHPVSDGSLKSSKATGAASEWPPVLPIYVVLCLASVLPFLLIKHPPIVDFPNHAARLFLACNISQPAVSDMFQYRLGIIPNLAVDLINVPLCGLMDPALVLKSTTAGALLLIYAAAWWIQHKLFGRANAFLFALPAMAFNLVTTMGYINFLVGIALSILLIAFAIGREDKPLRLVLICNVVGILIFFSHIFALVFTTVFFFGLLLGRATLDFRQIGKASAETALLFAAPLAFMLLVPSEGSDISIEYLGKPRMLFAPFMAQHMSVGLFGLMFFVLIYLSVRNGLVSVHRRIRVPLLTVAAFVVVVPSGVQHAVDVDSRMLVALAYLLFASLEPIRGDKRLFYGIAGSSAAVVAMILSWTFSIWQPFSARVAEVRQASAVIPPGTKVLSISESKRSPGVANPMAYTHLTSYATMDRLIFNPLEFTGIGMQPLSVTPKYATVNVSAALPFGSETAIRLAHPTAELERRARKTSAEYALRWPERFDYVLYYHFGGRANFDPVALEEVHRGSFFSILKVRRD